MPVVPVDGNREKQKIIRKTNQSTHHVYPAVAGIQCGIVRMAEESVTAQRNPAENVRLFGSLWPFRPENLKQTKKKSPRTQTGVIFILADQTPGGLKFARINKMYSGKSYRMLMSHWKGGEWDELLGLYFNNGHRSHISGDSNTSCNNTSRASGVIVLFI